MKISDLSMPVHLNSPDKKRVYMILSAAVLFVFMAWAGYRMASGYAVIKRMAAVKKEEIVRFRELSQEYLEKRSILDSAAKKAYASGGESTIAIVENIGARAGVRGRITSLKPAEEKDMLGYRTRGVEVRFERITLNELINIIYAIENNRALFVIDEFSMKGRFEDPNLLDVAVRLAHITKQGP